MRRSIELGRAVLSTSAANLELWLRTLITISPQQQCTNLHEQSATSLLSLLSSGEVWIGRGNGMYIDLDLTFKGQPVPDEQLRQLSEAILNAQSWIQLNLQPSLPHNTDQAPGKLRITVRYASERAAPAVKQRHRLLSNTFAAHVKPPEGVPVLLLDSVLLSADIFELIERRKVTTTKRVKVSTDSSSSSVSQLAFGRTIDTYEQEASDELLLEADNVVPSPASPSTLKRMRSTAPSLKGTICLPFAPSIRVHQDCRLTSRVSNAGVEAQNSRASLDIGTLQMLIDGAIRLSILSNINSKMFPGVKVKANTFESGLADIAPTLWKTGYPLSLSQRANLLPVIGRSLCQPAATTKPMSMSFRKKLAALARPILSLQSASQMLDRKPTGILDRSHLAPHIAPRLWLYLQNNTPCKSTIPLQSFVTTELPSTSGLQAEGMLGESWQEGRINHRFKPSTVGPTGGGASDVDQILEGHPAIPGTCYGVSSEQHLLGAATASDHALKVGDDELLLGDECFEPLTIVTYHGNEIS